MDFSYIARIFPALMQGAGTTLLLFALVFPFSLPLGFLITLCANCRFRPVKWIAQAYIFVMRGTPLMRPILQRSSAADCSPSTRGNMKFPMCWG